MSNHHHTTHSREHGMSSGSGSHHVTGGAKKVFKWVLTGAAVLLAIKAFPHLMGALDQMAGVIGQLFNALGGLLHQVTDALSAATNGGGH